MRQRGIWHQLINIANMVVGGPALVSMLCLLHFVTGSMSGKAGVGLPS